MQEYDLEEHVDQLARRVGALEHLVRLLMEEFPRREELSIDIQRLLDLLVDDPNCR